MKQIIIYGAGGFGREVAWLVQSCNVIRPRYEIVCFVDDNQAMQGRIFNEINIIDLKQAKDAYSKARVVCGVGIPRIRESIVKKVQEIGYDFETIIHPKTERSQWIDIGKGTIICAGNILTTDIIVGNHVHINLGCTVGHDVQIGDYSTLSPGVHVSGFVHIGSRVYVGTGAVFVNGTEDAPLIIGDDARIGAGACVTKSIEPGQTVVGVPARPIHKRKNNQ